MMNIKDKAEVFNTIKYMIKTNENNHITERELVDLLTSNAFIHNLSKYINNLKRLEIKESVVPRACSNCGDNLEPENYKIGVCYDCQNIDMQLQAISDR